MIPDNAIKHMLAELGELFGFDDVWCDLGDLQRAVLRLLAEHTKQIYGETSIKRMAALTGREEPSNPKVQSAIRRLSRLGVAEKLEDQWKLNDPLLEVWVRARPKRDFSTAK